MYALNYKDLCIRVINIKYYDIHEIFPDISVTQILHNDLRDMVENCIILSKH